MNWILAEALSLTPVQDDAGHPLHLTRQLDDQSPKTVAMRALLEHEPIPFFLRVHDAFCALIHSDEPLVIVTDWSDPCEVVGLRLETPEGMRDMPQLCFLALETNWDDLSTSGIEHIFGHELSHLWLHRLGYDAAYSRSNRFHTVTAITDSYLAFAEGFAEHLEILSAERMGTLNVDALYDRGYDVGAWLCLRDEALRIHGVRENRFLYLPALPEEDGSDYAALHAAHNTSSSVMPERLKNGAQAMASEGLIASFFYRVMRCDALLNAPLPDALSAVLPDAACAQEALLLKELWALSHVRMDRPHLFTDFVAAYGACFPQEREAMLRVFAEVTELVTVSREAPAVFGTLYRIGRQGDVIAFKEALSRTNTFKKRIIDGMLSGELALDGAVSPALWMDGDKAIRPMPWATEHLEPLRFDANTATAVDFYSLRGLTLAQCRALETQREQQGGFATMEAFLLAANALRSAES